ncbi:MAG: response regulator transcription factor [Pseudomonadota bacterium]
MNVLLVEDEARVADFITRGLRGEGWVVEHVVDGETALELLAEGAAFDVVVLDLMLPGLSGSDVCRRMRARHNHEPVLMLTALDTVDDRVEGLRTGADDYLSKPFAFDELVARIEALVRRRRNFESATEPDSTLRYGEIVLDTKAMITQVGGTEIELTAKERAILLLFLSNPGRVLARERILNAVWGTQADPLTNTVDVHVGRLRKKLGEHADLIRTVRGAGYRFGN